MGAHGSADAPHHDADIPDMAVCRIPVFSYMCQQFQPVFLSNDSPRDQSLARYAPNSASHWYLVMPVLENGLILK
jgi:hypothetical protein